MALWPGVLRGPVVDARVARAGDGWYSGGRSTGVVAVYGVLGPVAQLLQLGAILATPIVLGALLGWWLDGQFGLSPWGVLVGLLLGVVLGGVAVWRLIETVLGPPGRPGPGAPPRGTPRRPRQ